MCVIIIALVFLLIFEITSSGRIFQFARSQSTATGFNPSFITHKAVEIIEKVGIITSSFFFRFRDLRAISNAAVPFDTATAYFLFMYFENFFSNCLTKFPSDYIQRLSKHSFTLILS